jgi:hypothetical protein
MERLAYASGAEKRRCSTPRHRSPHWFPGQPQRRLPVLKRSIGSAHDCAVVNGADRLPTSSGRKIVPLGTNCGGRSICGAQPVPAAAVFAGFIRWSTGSWNRWNPSKFPWFTNEFAHPGELKAV